MSGTVHISEFRPGDRNSLRIVVLRCAGHVRPLGPLREGQLGSELLRAALAAKERDLSVGSVGAPCGRGWDGG